MPTVEQAAERAGTKYASSVIYHSKRLIGCKYGEDVLQVRLHLFAFISCFAWDLMLGPHNRMSQDAANLRWPFKVVELDGIHFYHIVQRCSTCTERPCSAGNAAMQITVAGEAKMVTPEEVGAGILSYLKKVSRRCRGRNSW